MLKIAVDATPIREKPSGIGIYTLNLINSLAQQEEIQLSIAYQPSVKKWLRGDLSFSNPFNLQPNPYIIPIPVTISNFLGKIPNPVLPYLEKKLNVPDIVHGTDHYVYPCRNSQKIMTIHDLTFIKYPNYTNSITKTYSNRIKQCLKWTDLVITFSQSTKKDIVEYLRVKPERIYVTPQASRYSSEYLFHKTNKYDFSKPYILFVSTIEPRKNIKTLVDAFNILKQKHKLEHQLVLIGQKGWNCKPILAAIENSPWQNQIHQLGYLSDREVALFYTKADVFVYPSYYEGFGLPVLEAMTLGAPVVTSNTSSLPEVAGDAALLIDPHDPTQLADAILRVISDPQLRQELIQKGKERAKLFSWERTAKETIKAYKYLSRY